MIEWNSALPKAQYDVQIGLLRVQVRGVSRDDAISKARTKLCREMPRMWDVIHALDDSRFEVTRQEHQN